MGRIATSPPWGEINYSPWRNLTEILVNSEKKEVGTIPVIGISLEPDIPITALSLQIGIYCFEIDLVYPETNSRRESIRKGKRSEAGQLVFVSLER